ncbi:MAG: hypothetical protein Q4C70_04195, partial [Planctomycetia bacterium]|nr:hypothetical protein [Planctomycetia bacterium]
GTGTGTGTEETVEVVTKSVIMGQRFSRYGEKIGSEFYVSDFMDGFQTVPDVAMDMYGNFVVTWTVNGRDLNKDGMVDNNERAYYDVYARVYDASGTAITPSFLVEDGFKPQINADKTPYADGTEAGTEEETTPEVTSLSTTPGKQRNSMVAISPDCSQFIITWTNVDSRVSSTYSAEGITDTYGIFAQRFSISGEKIGSAFVVNANDKYDQDSATVGMDDDYNVYVVWQSSSDANTGLDIYARKFDANNQAVSGNIQVNTTTRNDQKTPVIAVNDAGQFVVAWATQTGSSYDVAFRCFDSNMNAYGSETIANSITTFNQNEPSVAITRKAENGTRFAVSWSSYGQENTTEKSWGVYMNIYDSVETRNSVTETRKEILVNSYLAKDESASDLAMTAFGDIGAVWMGPADAATGEVSMGTDTDIFHKVYYNAVLDDYVPLEDGSSIGGIVGTGQNKHSVGYNSTLANGGGSVTVKEDLTTIQTAANSNNKFVFQASAGKPTVTLNNVEITLTGSGNRYELDASNIATYDCAVVVNGLGGEAVSVADGIVNITCGAYTLLIKGASSFLFNGENVAVDFTAKSGEMLEVNGNSVALATKVASYRVEGCTNIIATASGAAIAKISGTDDEEEFAVNGNSVTLSGGKVAVDVRNFEEVYLSGADGDQVVFGNTGAFTVQGNVVDYVGMQNVHASYFTNVMANAGGTANVVSTEGTQIQVNDSALVIAGGNFTQTISGLNMSGNVAANADSLTVGAVTLNGFADASASVTLGNVKNLMITGSEADETVTMNGATVSFSSASYSFTANGVTSLTVDGKGGNDTVTIYDSAVNDQVSFIEGVAKVNDNVEIRGCASVAVIGANGGNMGVEVIGSKNNDTFTLSDTHFVGTVAGTTLTVAGANSVSIQGNGGNDTLIASDSASDDTFTLTPGSLVANVAGATWNADEIQNLKVYQINGGNDTLTLNDSAENDKVILSPKYVTMSNSSATITASGFAKIAVNSETGNDTLVMYDSTSDDVVTVENGTVSMGSEGFFNQISGFRKVNLYAINGGNDTAEIKAEYDVLDSIFAVEDENWTVKGIGFEI